jgi:signal transduction histidine kinase
MSSNQAANILLVDDRPENLLALEAVLADLGQNLLRAGSGREALRLLLEEQFAAVLLDVRMPDMDGFETARAIRSRERTRGTPILFITAEEKGEHEVLSGYALGAVDYLTKPFSPQVLKAKVSAFVELSQQQRALEAEVARRQEAEEALRRANAELERRVAERTAELEGAHAGLEQLYQQVLENSRRKDEWLALLAHELRNPLGAASNAVTILQMSHPDYPAWHRALEILERQLRQESRLVDDLLEAARLTSGRISLQRETFDLRELVAEAAGDHQTIMEAAGLTLTSELPDGRVWVHADCARIAQVLSNLLANALKFTDPGGRVVLRLTAAQDGPVAAVTVQDTGIGIRPEAIPGLFEPFTQEDNSLARSRGGLGLGLPLVKGLVRLHGGEVRAFSAGLGCGSEFTFVLPLATPGECPVERAPVRRRPSAVSLRILVIEDSRDAAESLRDILELFGHEARVALTGTQGVIEARSFQPDVVICDLGLPGLDGCQVAECLRREAALSGTRLIALTGYASPEDRARARDAGFERHLVKPVDPEELRSVLAAPAPQPSV